MAGSSATGLPLVPTLGATRLNSAPVIESAGALVWREHHGELQVRLIHRPKYRDWSWPKGKLDPGEAFQTAAAREVAEETGKPVVLGRPLPGLQYLTPEGRVKRVHYWAARRATARIDGPALAARAPVPPVSTDEIDDAAWLNVTEAAERLTRPADVEPLRALDRAWKRGRLATHAFAIVRHGKAVSRATWYGTEARRPLTPAGHAQAAALIPVLAAYGVGDVVTSQWERCAQTITPYANAAGIETRASDHLTEVQHERSAGPVTRTVTELLNTRVATALCTHRPVLPTVFEVLAASSRRPVARALPTKDPYLEPGEMLMVHVAITPKGPRVVAAEKISPPMH